MNIAAAGLFTALLLVAAVVWNSRPAQTQGAGSYSIVSSGKSDAAFRLNVATGEVHFCHVRTSNYGRTIEGACSALATE